jgi:hypothetical protein
LSRAIVAQGAVFFYAQITAATSAKVNETRRLTATACTGSSKHKPNMQAHQIPKFGKSRQFFSYCRIQCSTFWHKMAQHTC